MRRDIHANAVSEAKHYRRKWILGLMVGLLGTVYFGIGTLQEMWLLGVYKPELYPNADRGLMERLLAAYGVATLLFLAIAVYACVRIVRGERRSRVATQTATGRR